MAGTPQEVNAIKGLTKAVHDLDRTLQNFIRIAEALNTNMVAIGRTMKDENEHGE